MLSFPPTLCIKLMRCRDCGHDAGLGSSFTLGRALTSPKWNGTQCQFLPSPSSPFSKKMKSLFCPLLRNLKILIKKMKVHCWTSQAKVKRSGLTVNSAALLSAEPISTLHAVHPSPGLAGKWPGAEGTGGGRRQKGCELVGFLHCYFSIFSNVLTTNIMHSQKLLFYISVYAFSSLTVTRHIHAKYIVLHIVGTKYLLKGLAKQDLFLLHSVYSNTF